MVEATGTATNGQGTVDALKKQADLANARAALAEAARGQGSRRCADRGRGGA